MMRILSSRTLATLAHVAVCRVVPTGLGLLTPFVAVKDVSACGGPCAVPELWSLQPTNAGVVVVSNFGLIGRGSDDAWVLACEEHIGGILLDVKASGDWLVALTDTGVRLSHDGVCSWEAGPTSEFSDWFLDSAVSASSQDEPDLLVLTPDAVEQNTKLERSNAQAFEVVRAFDPSVAFRNLVASETLEQVFVSGYSQGPRTWHLSYSLDAGENWSDLIPSEVDNTGAVMVPKRVDPNKPGRLFLAAQTQSGGGDQVWLFDSANDETRLLATLEDSEVLSNLTFLDGQVWVAGRRNGGGSLYRADANALEFTRVVSGAPSLACLETVGSTLLTCANDYSYESSFIVAEVKDQGALFDPQMRVADLVGLHACDDSCTATLDWLNTTYGDSTSIEDAGTSDSDTASQPEPERAHHESSGCSATPAPVHPKVWLGFILAATTVVRRRRWSVEPRRVLSAAADRLGRRQS